jgi:hypothetical protein
VLEAAGVEFIAGDGVRLRKETKARKGPQA